MIEKTAPTLTHRIWIAGDYDTARRIVNEFCSATGECFAVQLVDYIYTGGEERGVCVTRINYPRFPACLGGIETRVRELAELLREELNQHSYSIEGPGETVWCSHRSTVEREEKP